jgi:hypothetical protein
VGFAVASDEAVHVSEAVCCAFAGAAKVSASASNPNAAIRFLTAILLSHKNQYKNMPQICELELAAVTVKVVPAMLHAAAIGVVPWTCA